MDISVVVTCEERIKSLDKASKIISGSYTLGVDPYSHLINRIVNEINQLKAVYEKDINKRNKLTLTRPAKNRA